MEQNLIVLVAFLAHYGGAYLAEAYAVAPSRAGYHEPARHAAAHVFGVYHEGAAVQVAVAEGAAYLQFLAYGEGALRAHYGEAADAPAASALHGSELYYVAEVDVEVLFEQPCQFLLRVFHVPAVEVGCFLVVVVEHLRQNLRVGGVAERLWRGAYPSVEVFLAHQFGGRRALIIVHRLEVRHLLILPAVAEKKIDEVYKLYFNEDKVNKLLESYKPVMELCMPYMPDIELTKYPIDTYWDVVMTVPDIIQENLGKFKFAFQHPTPMFVSIPKEDKQGRLCLSWEPSYSYQNRPITYNVRISTDYHMENVVFEKQGIAETDLNTDLKLTPGTYYLDVRAVDSAGHEQVSLEHYEQTGISFEYIDGLMQFELK